MNVNSFNILFLKVVKSTHFPELKYTLKPLIRAAHILTKLLLNLHKKKSPQVSTMEIKVHAQRKRTQKQRK